MRLGIESEETIIGKSFFHHTPTYLLVTATPLENGYPASWVMDAIKGPLVIRSGQDRRFTEWEDF